MKKFFLLFALSAYQCICLVNTSFSQNDPWTLYGNVVDTSAFLGTKNQRNLRFMVNNVEYMRLTTAGRLGLGTTNPNERLQVNGNINLSGDLIFTQYTNLSRREDVYLVLDSTGQTRMVNRNGMLQDFLAADCFSTGKYGESVTSSPTWASAPGTTYGKLFTGHSCPAWVGIGTNNPLAHLHIRSQNNSSNLKLFLVEGHFGNATTRTPIFQITNDGITRAREIIVDLQTWPDYVFRPSYSLMPLRDLRLYINTYGHLPNVPPAAEIETSGLSLNENARITMEKIEELTLYVLDLQEQIDVQNAVIEQQMVLLQQMQELLKMYMGEATQPQAAPSGNQ